MIFIYNQYQKLLRQFRPGLLEIYRELPESHKDKIILSLNRHDYMYAAPDHTDKNAFLHGQFKLVSINVLNMCHMRVTGVSLFDYFCLMIIFT